MRASAAGRIVCAVCCFALVAQAQTAPATEVVSFDDTARLLAGMSVSDQSPLLPLTQDAVAKQHAAHFDVAFSNLEKNQLSKIRAWSAANLTNPQPVMFYMFGGPDFLYADAFFPDATTYVLSGLEPVGPIPDHAKMPRWAAMQGLRAHHLFCAGKMAASLIWTICDSDFPILLPAEAAGVLSADTARAA